MPERRDRDPRVVASRDRIAAAAHALFLQHGYGAVVVGSIAREAGVAIQTIYNTVGPKAAVLELVLDRAAAGPDAPTPVAQFLARRAAEAPDAGTVIELLADWFSDVHPRIAPVLAIISAAAATDPAIAELDRRRAQQRLDNYRLAARELQRRSALAEGLTIDAAAAMIWATGHPQVHQQLCVHNRWTVSRYRRWLTRSLAAQLLETPR